MSSAGESDEEGHDSRRIGSDDEPEDRLSRGNGFTIPRRTPLDLPDDDESPAEEEDDVGRRPSSHGSGSKGRVREHDDDTITPARSQVRKAGPSGSEDEIEPRFTSKKIKQEKRRSNGKRDLSGDEYSDGEDGPFGDDARVSKKQKVSPDLDDADGGQQESKLTPFQKAKEQATASRRSRKKKLDPAVIETECVAFLERMMKARDDDLKSFKKGQPALEKIKMLREVEMMMTKVQHREYLLDNMLLPVFRAWLDTLPDGTLPNVQVRTTLLTILYELRIDEDWVERLEGSRGLGKVIHFLSRNEDYEPNRRLAEKTMMKWARPVYNMNSNFNELLDEFNKPEEGHRAPKDSVAAERKAAMKTVRRLKTTEEKLSQFQNSKKGDTRVLASAPKPTPFLFTTVAEGSTTIDENVVREVRSNKAKTKKINRTMSTLRRLNKRNGSRGSGPSVNGR